MTDHQNKKRKINEKTIDKSYESLKQENERLKKRLKFLNEIFDDKFEHSSSQVYQIQEQKINGESVWINTQTITPKQLKELDMNDSVKKIISEKMTRYDDYSWYRDS
jgi:hypothetical protein